MKQRIITGAILALIVTSVFLLREFSLTIFDAFIAFAIVFSVGEVSRVFIRSGRTNFMELATIYAVVVYLALIWGINSAFSFGSHLLTQVALLIIFFAIAFLLTYLRKKEVLQSEHFINSKLSIYEYAMKKSFRTLFVMVYPTLLLSFLYLLNHIENLNFNLIETAFNGANASPDLGLVLLLMTFVVTMATDTFAYFVGSTVGGPKLAPLISPKKTISGAIGGLVGGIITALAIFFILNADAGFNTAFFQAEITVWHFLAYGFVAAVVSEIGDLFASVVKRRARAKDFSSIFPGHGGFMDRLDGISFNAVFTFIFVVLFFV